jgi:hypothetical protein
MIEEHTSIFRLEGQLKNLYSDQNAFTFKALLEKFLWVSLDDRNNVDIDLNQRPESEVQDSSSA